MQQVILSLFSAYKLILKTDIFIAISRGQSTWYTKLSGVLLITSYHHFVRF